MKVKFWTFDSSAKTTHDNYGEILDFKIDRQTGQGIFLISVIGAARLVVVDENRVSLFIENSENPEK